MLVLSNIGFKYALMNRWLQIPTITMWLKVIVCWYGDDLVAICPHIKCIVEWNPINTTFDYPCHGSIFDHTRHCINGLAKANLPVYEE